MTSHELAKKLLEGKDVEVAADGTEPQFSALCLCESRHLVLRPGRFYSFNVIPDCKECVEIYEEGKLP